MTSPTGIPLVTPIAPAALLTPHFTYRETWCHPNAKAKRDAGFPEFIEPPLEMVQRYIVPLLQQLEILRAVWGLPMALTSVFRSLEYNDWLYTSEGHTPTHSQHCFGRAADVVVKTLDPKLVHDTARELWKNGTLKIGGLGSYPSFTHIDTRPVIKGHLAQWSGSRAGN
jgi:uncharacterized protein YcbK (DUF882 family)